MVIFYALVALCFSSGALAQIAGWGGCPNVQAMKDFNIREVRSSIRKGYTDKKKFA